MFGKVGYIGKGIAIAIVGGLITYGGSPTSQQVGQPRPGAAQGAEHPFGPVLLVAIAIGIGCYGLFCFARARHLSK